MLKIVYVFTAPIEVYSTTRMICFPVHAIKTGIFSRIVLDDTNRSKSIFGRIWVPETVDDMLIASPSKHTADGVLNRKEVGQNNSAGI